jgi:DNA-binding MarR family transcriptional regulator
MSTTPSLNGQLIGQAEHATRALLERLLSRSGTTFHQWVAINLTAINGDSIERDQLSDRMTDALKIDDSAVLATVDELSAAGLLEAVPSDAPRIGLTSAGRARYRDIRTAIDEVSPRLYGDLDADDLATAGRMLATVTARANAELAAG